jgi:hypothetical protein
LQPSLHVQVSDPPLPEDAERKAKNHAAAEAVKAKKDKETGKRKRALKQLDEDDEDDDDEDADEEMGRWPSDSVLPPLHEEETIGFIPASD